MIQWQRLALLVLAAGCGTPLIFPTAHDAGEQTPAVTDGGQLSPVDAGAKASLTDLQLFDNSTEIAAHIGALTFGDVQVLTDLPVTKTLTLNNRGASTFNLAPSAFSITGLGARDFTVSTSGLTLGPGHMGTFTVAFVPTSVGPRSATLLITTTLGTFDLELQGVGTAHHLFVGVGNQGRRIYSTDGINWLEADHDEMNHEAPTDCPDAAHQFTGPHGQLLCKPVYERDTNGFMGVCYGNGRYIATAGNSCQTGLVGADGGTYTKCGVKGFTYLSLDGKKWRRVADAGGMSCAYGNGTFVIATDGTAPLISTDGLTWAQGGDYLAEDGPKVSNGELVRGFTRVIFDGQRFVTTGQLDTVLTSVDGRNWSAPAQVEGQNVNNVALVGSGGRALILHSKIAELGETWVDGRVCTDAASCLTTDAGCIASNYHLSEYPTLKVGCYFGWGDDHVSAFQVSTSTSGNDWAPPVSWNSLLPKTPVSNHSFSGAASADGHIFLFGADMTAVLDDTATSYVFKPRTFSYSNPEGIVAGPVGSDGKRVFVGTGWQAEIFWSVDEGQSWQRYDMTKHKDLDNFSWAAFTYGRDPAP